MSEFERKTAPFTVEVPAVLEPIMERYLEILREELVQIMEAMADGDAEGVRVLGHRIKGSGAAYGFDELTGLGLGIEEAGGAGDLDRAARLADVLAAYITHLNVAFV